MTRLTRIALDHAGITLFASLALFVAGLFAFFNLNRELIPDVEFPAATVVTIWPGASASDVAKDVTKPIEDAMDDLDDIDVTEVSSRTSESFSIVIVNAELGTSQEQLREVIEDQLNTVDLPVDAEDPDVLLFDFGDIPAVSMSASGDLPLPELEAKVDLLVVPELEDVDGVAEVSVTGGLEDQIQITLDAEKLAAAGLTIETIQGVLAANNLSLPAGTLMAGGSVIPLQVSNRIRNVDDLRNLVVSPGGPPAMVGAPGDAPGGPPAGIQPPTGAVPPEAGEPASPTEATEPATEEETAEPAEPTGRVQVVVVGENDTLESLAERYGSDPDAIREANNLTSDELTPGATLRVPLLAAGEELPPIWQLLGATTASEITPELLQLALQEFPAAVEALSDEQLLAMPVETLQVLPLPFLLRQPEDLRDAINNKLRGEPEAMRPEDLSPKVGLLAPVRQDGPITLGDVATVERAPDDASTINRTDGQSSLGISVFKENDANTVNVVNDVEEVIADLEDMPELSDITFNVVFEQGSFIEESLNGVLLEGLLGAIFAILVILVFLNFSVRSTIVTAVSIPLSLLFALLLMYLQGLSLNLLTLSGLTVAVGRVVDDAIVVMENIYRHMQRGDKRYDSVYEGTREVITAITASTLVAVAVFLPLGFIGGITTEFFGPFGLTATYALLASLFVAVTVVPVLARKLMRPPVEGKTEEEQETWLQRLYTPSLEWALNHRLITLLLAGIFFLLSLSALRFIPTTFLPAFGEKVLTIDLSTPPGTDLDTTNQVALAIEEILAADEDVDVVQTTVGSSSQAVFESTAGNTARASFFATFAGPDEDQSFFDRIGEEEVDPDEVADRLRANLPAISDQFGGLPITFTISAASMMAGGGGGYDLQIKSDDEEVLRKANALIVAALRDPANWEEDETIRERIFGEDEDKSGPDIPIINLSSNLSEARDVVSVDVDPAAALQRGLTTAQVGFALRQVLEGQDLGSIAFDDDGEETLDVVARFPEETIASVEALADYMVMGPAGPVRLGDIATIETQPGPVEISRIDGQRAALLAGEITDEDTFGAIAKADEIIDQVLEDNFTEDERDDVIEVGAGAQTSQEQEGFADLLVAIALSIVIVYLIMVVTFRSLVHPFTILFSIPFAVSGALIALALTGRPLSLSSLIGMLLLTGIVATNAIVLVDLVLQYQKRGMDTYTALVRAGRVRLRPILMTALATILALLPQALGLAGEGGIFAGDLATAVIGGLFTSTLLTLLIVPVIFSLFDPITRRGDEPSVDEAHGDESFAPPPDEPLPPPDEPLPDPV